MSEPQLIVIADVHGQGARREELGSLLRTLATETNGEPGCLAFRVLEEGEPGEFVLLESWLEEEALRAHYRTPHYQYYRSHVGALLARPSDVVLHRISATVYARDPNPPDPSLFD